MDKNTLIGILLIGVIFIAFMFVNQKEQEAINKANQAQQAEEIQVDGNPSIATETISDSSVNVDVSNSTSVQLQSSKENSDSLINGLSLDELARRKQKFGIFYPSIEGEKQYSFLENDKVKIKFSNVGGRIVEVSLIEKDENGNYIYKTHNDFINTINNPIQLFEEQTSNQELSFNIKDKYGDYIPVSTKNLFFENVLQNDSTLVFKLKTEDANKALMFRYFLSSNSYHVNYSIDYSSVEDEVDMGSSKLDWSMRGLSTEKLADDERMTCSVMFRYDGETRDYISERTDGKEQIDGNLDWVAFKYKFFSSILITDGGKYEGEVSQTQLPEDDEYTIVYNSSLYIPYPESGKTDLKFFFGPNESEVLSSYDLAMDQIINLGWGIFRWTNNLLIEPIFNLIKRSGLSFGLVILLVTLIVKLIILPLTYKNYKSSAKMRVLKPEIEKINKKYEGKTDKDIMMKKQQETMGLYRKTGVNPMSGCIPMLVQMPILLAVFRFIPSSIDLRHQGFLWAEDLSSYDAIVSWSAEIPLLSSFYGNHVSLFTLLMAVSTLFYTLLNSNQMAPSQPGMPNMKVIMYIFPFMMLFFFNTYSSGLSYYYLCGNLMNLGIMWAIKKYMIDEDKIRLQIEENKKKPKKKSKFQQRMEEMAKKQQKRR